MNTPEEGAPGTGPCSLCIDAEFTVARAQELQPQVLGDQVREIDLSGVTCLDTAGLQLLMVAKREALAAGRELRLVRHSQAVLEVFDLLNVAAYFGDHLVMDCDGSTARS